MNRPLVSILTSSYNAERYIREALDSALAQTYQNVEVVVIDAGSTDGTAEIVKSYTDPRVRYIAHAHEPIKVTRNALLKEARGEYLTFLDSDDIYLPEKITREVEFLETHSEYALTYCDLRYFFDGEPEKLYSHRYTFYSGNILLQLLDKMFITNTTLMFRREVYEKLGGYDESLGMVEDWDYFLRIAHAGYQFGFLPEDLVRYRLRWDNHTSFKNQAPIQESALAIFEHLARQMSDEERERYDMDIRIARRKMRAALALLAYGEKSRARELLRSTFSVGTGERMIGTLTYLFSFLPSPLLRFAIERSWAFKKKNLFVPV